MIRYPVFTSIAVLVGAILALGSELGFQPCLAGQVENLFGAPKAMPKVGERPAEKEKELADLQRQIDALEKQLTELKHKADTLRQQRSKAKQDGKKRYSVALELLASMPKDKFPKSGAGDAPERDAANPCLI